MITKENKNFAVTVAPGHTEYAGDNNVDALPLHKVKMLVLSLGLVPEKHEFNQKSLSNLAEALSRGDLDQCEAALRRFLLTSCSLQKSSIIRVEDLIKSYRDMMFGY